MNLLAYLRSLFEWTVENEYFELTMSICTRLGVRTTVFSLRHFALSIAGSNHCDTIGLSMVSICGKWWFSFCGKSSQTSSVRWRSGRIVHDFDFNYRQFEAYAADILDLCYADNETRTLTLLDEKSTLYFDQQPSILIDDLCSKTLVSTKCMQSYMNRIWYGDQFHKEKNFTWELLVIERTEAKTST